MIHLVVVCIAEIICRFLIVVGGEKFQMKQFAIKFCPFRCGFSLFLVVSAVLIHDWNHYRLQHPYVSTTVIIIIIIIIIHHHGVVLGFLIWSWLSSLWLLIVSLNRIQSLCTDEMEIQSNNTSCGEACDGDVKQHAVRWCAWSSSRSECRVPRKRMFNY